MTKALLVRFAAALAAVLFLGAVGSVGARADPGEGDGAVVTTSTATANADSDQSGATNLNVSVLVGQPGDLGGVAQTNVSQADAAAAATSPDSDASAVASASQADPTNVNVSVRVASPGDDGAVTQANTAAADALAGSGPIAPTPTATVTQVAPANINVSVRVDSPGDQIGVSQGNQATAVAATVAPQTISATPPTNPDPDANSASVENSASVDQQLVQCGDPCPDSGSPGDVAPPAPQPVTPDASVASVTQTDPTNLSVSVRIASPGGDASGADATLTQSNGATASAATAIASTNGGKNLGVSLAVPGGSGATVASTGPAPWVWSWTWDLGTPTISAADASTDSSSWLWQWAAAPAAVVPAPVAGQWVWSWTWQNSSGAVTTVSQTQPCQCSWVWSWAWTGDPVASPGSSGSSTAPVATAPAVVQSNSASSSAVAVAGASATQTVTQPPAAGAAVYASQSLTVSQSAGANASAVQIGAGNTNLVSAGWISSLTQTNQVSADAAAAASLDAAQSIVQAQSGGIDGAAHLAGAWQTITIAQDAHAGARATQADASNRDSIASAAGAAAPIGPVSQSNVASAGAVATSSARVSQLISQSEATGGGGDQEAEGVQVSAIGQVATALARTTQSSVRNINDVRIPSGGLYNPPLTQANSVSSFAETDNEAVSDQQLVQDLPDFAATWTAVGEQLSTITQSGLASAAAEQSGRSNSAGWDGPVADSRARAWFGAAAPGERILPSTIGMGAAEVTGSPFGVPPAALPVVSRLPSSLGPAGTAAPALQFSLARGSGETPALATSADRSVDPAARRSSPSSAGAPVPVCRALCRLLDGTPFPLASTATAPGGPAAAPRAFFMLAAFFLWRPQLSLPAPGRPVFFTPEERPG